MLPTFLVIGAAKSGTTSVFNALRQHPQVYMSPKKETNYFGLQGESIAYQGPGDAEGIGRYSITEVEAYQALFEGVESQTAIGEASPLYLYFPSAAGRIHAHIPQVRLIAILRNPVDRAYSNFLHLRRDGREPLSDFRLALAEEEKRRGQNWSPFWYYHTLSCYYAQLKRYFDRFDRSQIRVYRYEEMARDPLSLLQDIFRFLGVQETFTPDTSVRYAATGIPRSRWVNALLTEPNLVKLLARRLVPGGWRHRVAMTLKNRNLSKPELPADLRSSLLDTFREDIERTQELVRQDLSFWLTERAT